jgi:hypothetical protein
MNSVTNTSQPQKSTSWTDDLTKKAEKGWSSFSSMFSSKPSQPQGTMGTFQTTGTGTTGTGTTGTGAMGGRRTKGRRRSGGNTTATNAAPVHGLQVAKPTYWIKGGKRTRRRKNKKCKGKSRRRYSRK